MKMITNDLASSINKEINKSSRILLVSHIRPDGDAVGSLIAFGLSLMDAGKEVQMVLNDGVPTIYKFLNGSDRIRKTADGPFDLVISLDSSDMLRLGEALEKDGIPDINIDHHITNLEFARINVIDHEAVATTEILTELLPLLGLTVSVHVAEALLTGLITDTLGFRTSNVRPQTLRTAADLMEVGADLPDLYRRTLLLRSYNAMCYWGVGLSRLQRENGIVWTVLTFEDRKNTGYPGRDDAELINLLSSIGDAEVALIFVEQGDGRVKVSWRALADLDVSQIAARFGGGGHKAAAGAMLVGSLDDVQNKALEATKELFVRI